MNFPINIVIQGKGTETLNKQSFVAAGGEGTVCRKGKLAYKLYHDPSKMVPSGKIRELKSLEGMSNVLGPQDIVMNLKNKPIGFTMPYIDQTEFLCRLFNRNFKSDNNITPQMIIELVRIMQSTLGDIHRNKILVVDFNEMNFLTDGKYSNVFFIDVDSYQTSSHRATALMESVRDRQGKMGAFDEGTDWFSFAVVTFQLYMGYHPYRKGKHPDFKPKDWSERMDKNVSVFHPDVQLGDNWKTWDLIPKPHYEWFKRVFQDKERSVPPLPDATMAVGIAQPLVVGSTQKFDVSLIEEYKEKILGVYFYNGNRYVITPKAIYEGSKVLHTFPSNLSGRHGLGQVVGETPVIANHIGQYVEFYDMKSTTISKVAADGVMQYNGNIYTLFNGKITENTFKSFTKGKIISTVKVVVNVFESATKLYPGVAVQNILNTCWLAIPYDVGRASNLHIKELDSCRIVEAKYENKVCILLSEKDGVYNRSILCFNDEHTKYTYRIDEDIDYTGINFTTLGNGVCIHIPTDDRVEVFMDNTKIKEVPNPPFKTDMRLINDGYKALFINQTRLYHIGLK